MKIKIFGRKEDTAELLQKVSNILEELWLNEFIQVEATDNPEFKNELNITKEPALVIEEESIRFKDVIFEWMIPPDEELKSMFISIIGWGESEGGCAPGWCGSWCSC